jgi:hypothetical protein
LGVLAACAMLPARRNVSFQRASGLLSSTISSALLVIRAEAPSLVDGAHPERSWSPALHHPRRALRHGVAVVDEADIRPTVPAGFVPPAPLVRGLGTGGRAD